MPKIKMQIAKLPTGTYYGIALINGQFYKATGYTHAGTIDRLFKYHNAIN